MFAIVATGTTAAVAKDIVPLPSENPTLTLQGFITPKSLPPRRQAPAKLAINAQIGTTDGTRPAALRTLTIDLDKNIVLDHHGFPVCQSGQRDVRSSHPWSKCEEALVGRGRVRLEVQFPGQASVPTGGDLRVINGGGAGLYAVAFVSQPITTAITMPITVEKRSGGHHRLILEIPKIANGAGSLTQLNLRLGRRVLKSGEPLDLLTASCPTGKLESQATAAFENGVTLQRLSLQTCVKAPQLRRPEARR